MMGIVQGAGGVVFGQGQVIGMEIDLAAGYYGEVDYKMRYKNITGEPFDWLYIDFETLAMYAEEYGFHCEKCIDGEHYDYLACITDKGNDRP